MGLTQVNVSIATFIPTGENSSISGGLQGSVVQRKVDFTKLIFPDQYNGSAYDAGISNGENPSTQNIIYPDVAAGLNWNYGFSESLRESNAKLKANVGASAYHINKAQQGFLTGSKEQVEMKYILHADFLIGLQNPNLALVPSLLCVFQGPVKEIIEGLMLKYYFIEGPKYYGAKASSTLGLGVSYRNKDAAIVSFLYEYGHYGFGISYDFNVSLLNNASRVKGGPEVFLRYVAPNQFGISHKHKSRYNL